MDFWHEIESGEEDKINVIIETPRGSRNKYEIDKKTGLIALDRALHTAQSFPTDYGFVPQTLWEDNDPLDVVVLSSFDLSPGILVKVRLVGMIDMIDSGESDVKIIGVPAEDPRWSHVKDIEDVNQHTLREVSHFFRTYKDLQDKVVEIRGIMGKKDALESFRKSKELYNNKYK